MMWAPQNIPAGWEVDSGYTTEDAARASAAAIVPAYETRVEPLTVRYEDGTTGERWCVLAREVER